jgi:hypothetical protein
MRGIESEGHLGWVLVSLSAIAWSTAGFFTLYQDERLNGI